MAQFQIIRTQLVPSPDLARVNQLDMLVVYQQTGGGAVRSVVIKNSAPTQPEVQAAIAAQENVHNALDGQTFTV